MVKSQFNCLTTWSENWEDKTIPEESHLTEVIENKDKSTSSSLFEYQHQQEMVNRPLGSELSRIDGKEHKTEIDQSSELVSLIEGKLKKKNEKLCGKSQRSKPYIT